MSESHLRIAVAQLNLLVGDIAGNSEKIFETARSAAHDGASLAVFSELAMTGYPPEDLLLRVDFLEQVEAELLQLAQRVEQAAPGFGLILGAPRRGEGQLFNSAFYLRHGELLAHYDKTALPNYSVFDEKRYFKPGGASCVVTLPGGVRAGLTICEDIWQQAGPALRARQDGAQLLINLNASPFHVGKGEQRSAILESRAHEIALPIVYANQVGGQDELVFDGDSRLIAADASTAYAAPLFDEHVFYFELACNEGDRAARVRCEGASRAANSQTETIWRALVVGLRDYVGKNLFEGVVVGLSGGVDSALTLVLAVQAVGAEHVTSVMMPSRYTSDMSLEDARTLATRLGVRLHEIDIEPVFEAMQQQLKEVFFGTSADVTEENMQSRIRGNLLMAIANKHRLAVINTGNKSEMAVGYATLYGDMIGAYAPLKDVVKTRVYELAEFCNTTSEVIPRRVLDRPPSAELAPGQVDQDSLPPYETLDRIIEGLIEADTSCAQLVADGVSEEDVRRVREMVRRSEYKRRQAPPGIRITQKAFGKDRRYPITSG